MSEPAQPENPMSNPERPLEGVTPHEQAVVKRAEEEARSASFEAVRQAGYVAPQFSSQEQTVSTLTGQIPETAKAIKEVRGQVEEGGDQTRALEEVFRRLGLTTAVERRVSREAIEFYSPEMLKILFLRKAEKALTQLQEKGEFPDDFRWISQQEIRNVQAVIEGLEEMVSLDPQTRQALGYPRFYKEEESEVEQNGKQVKAVVRTDATEQRIDEFKEEGRSKELKRILDAVSAFNRIFEFYGLAQRPLSVDAKAYHDIFIQLSKMGQTPPLGSVYKNLFEAPSLLPETPELGVLLDKAFRKLIEVTESKENPFIAVPSAEKRREALGVVKEELFKDMPRRDDRDDLYGNLAETAARIALLLAYHWDIPQSSVCKVDEGKGKVELETSHGDSMKMDFFSARCISDLRDYHGPFGNQEFTGAMLNLTDNFLRVASLTLEGAGGIKHRVSLWDLLKEYGFSLRDIPWKGEEIVLSDEMRTKFGGVRHRGKTVAWEKLTGGREDALNVPYYLHLYYVGKFYDILTTNDFPELIGKTISTSFWEDLNKPFDLGFKIFLGSRGLDEETIFKLMLIEKVNLVASILSAVEDRLHITEEEFRRLVGKVDGREVLSAVFKSGFLKEELRGIKLDEGTYAINIDVKGLIQKIIKLGRGIIPGDSLIANLFSSDEIGTIEKSRVYYPYHLRRRRGLEEDPLYIVDALNMALKQPKERA